MNHYRCSRSPLLFPDPDILLDLRQALDAVYERAAYRRRIDYSQPIPPPKARPVIAEWLATVGQWTD